MSWPLSSAIVLALALGAGFWWFERSRPPARMIALVATMAALCGLGRVAFAALPSVKPTTAMVLVCGVALGAAPGFAIGALAALSSNFFLGQGPWTPWQMTAWGAVGVVGALLATLGGRRPPRIVLALVAAACALAFSEVMNLSLVTIGGGPVLSQWALLAVRGIPFDVAHTVSSFLFAMAFAPELLRALQRFRTRMEFRWPAVNAPAAALVALLLCIGGAAGLAPEAGAATPSGYLLGAQNSDGGFGAGAGQGTSALFSGWAALGLAGSGYNPADVSHGGPSLLSAIRSQAAGMTSTGDIERTLIVLRASGASPSVAGRDLLGTLLARQDGAGSLGGQVNLTAFGVFAERAYGKGGAAAAGARWLMRQQDSDGGFNFARRGPVSDVDDTGAVLEALGAVGYGRTRTARRAVRFVRSSQNPDGGFPADSGGDSNAQSTAFAVQGLVATGYFSAGGGPAALGYLRSLVAPDGSVRYSRTSGQTPVWVTAQALPALARRPFPLAPLPRAARGAGGSGAGVAAGAPGTRSGPAGPFAPGTAAGGFPAGVLATGGASGAEFLRWSQIADRAGRFAGLVAPSVLSMD